MINRTLWIVPTRLRADKIRDHALNMKHTMEGQGQVLYAVDGDHDAQHDYGHALRGIDVLLEFGPWRGLSGTLNFQSHFWAERYTQMGFLGDDHYPSTFAWDTKLFYAIDADPLSIAYGPDGQTEETSINIPLTYWAMDSRIIRLLNQMVPYPLSHNCVDDYIWQLGHQSDALHYVSGVTVEHRHPLWSKAESDRSYELSSEHHNRLADHEKWKEYQRCQLPHDVALLRAARGTSI